LGERLLETEARSPDFERAINFGHKKHEIADVTVDEIPTIAMKFVLDMLDEPLRPIEPDCLLAPNHHPQQSIKTDEMIDMSMRDKDVLKPLDLSRRQVRNVTEVEQDRALFKQCLNVEGRVSGSPVDKSRVQKRPHTNF